MQYNIRRWVIYIDEIFTKIFRVLIVSFFVSATGLYALQMLLRILFSKAIFWIDPTISYLFTISALSGAALAVRNNENIKIDLLKKYNHLKSIQLIKLSFSLGVSIVIVLIFVGHFAVVWQIDEGDVIFPKWSLDLPYIFLFIGSIIYVLKNIFLITFKNQTNKT